MWSRHDITDMNDAMEWGMIFTSTIKRDSTKRKYIWGVYKKVRNSRRWTGADPETHDQYKYIKALTSEIFYFRKKK